ncbi:MAG: NAD(P)/FAD-dependent oxidoreductase [Thermodesulfobacteriota bacterium]
MRYDCIIVGTGPAGIFAALELKRIKGDARVLLIEKGPDISERDSKDIFHGWGGAGTFSDGKLNLSGEVGGYLDEYIGEEELEKLIRYIDDIYVRYGAPAELHGVDKAEVRRLEEAAAGNGLRLVSFRIRHLGTDRCLSLLKNLRSEMEGAVDISFNTDIEDIIEEGGKAVGVRGRDGSEYLGDHVILAPGRVGSRWLEGVVKRLSLQTVNNPVDIGVRVEAPASILRHITDVVHEAKFIYNSLKFDDRVRTFCMNPYGVVVAERHVDFCTVNGHSYSTRKGDNTNFAILVSTTFTEPFHEPIAYGQYIAKLANLLGEGIIVQRLGDLLHGRRSTPERINKGAVVPSLKEAVPGDLSFAIPYRYLSDILEMLEALDRVAPGINAASTLLYGIEVKFYSMKLKLSRSLETGVKNLFAIGDGAGVTRSIIQASASGIVAARETGKRIG